MICECRESSRLYKDIPLKIQGENYPDIQIKDLSEGGIGLIISPIRDTTKKIVEILLSRQFLQLELSLVPEFTKIDSQAKMVWYTYREGKYEVGMKFYNLDEFKREILAKYFIKEVATLRSKKMLDRLPMHILYKKILKESKWKKVIGNILIWVSTLWVKRQRAFLKKTNLDKDTVCKLYNFEAKKYLYKHAVCTHRKDDAWRLWLGQVIVSKIQQVNQLEGRLARHLDLFAGTGLSYAAQAKVFNLFNVSVHSFLLDYSQGMLEIACQTTLQKLERENLTKVVPLDILKDENLDPPDKFSITVTPVQGDATNFIEENRCLNQSNLVKLPANYFDVISIMFGIGGVSLQMALKVSQESLKALKNKGRFAITDMHRPIPELAGRWQWPLPVEFRWPWFESELYRRLVTPYALNRLWAWHDTTLYPYLMKLAVVNENGQWYGWDEFIFEIESQTWDFGIPVMSTYKQVLIKVEISEQEARERIFVFDNVLDSLRIDLRGYQYK